MYEVYTYGGASYLIDTFNAVSALIYSGGHYSALIKITMIFTLIWLGFKTAFSSEVFHNYKWFGVFLVTFNVLLVPQSKVIIIDEVNGFNHRKNAVVENVPYGLAVFASYTSQIGHKLTELMETSFSKPDDLQYHKTGMVFGAKLQKMLTNVHISDSIFAQNMESFSKQCIFYSLLLGHMDFNELKNSTDIWGDLVNNGKLSRARSFELRTKKGDRIEREIITCAKGAANLNHFWNKETNHWSNKLSARLYGHNTNNFQKAKILTSIGSTHNYLINASKDAANIMRQQMMINAINNGLENWASSMDSSAALQNYAQVRSQLYIRSAYESIGRQAGKAIPFMKIVFECLYIGLFPLAFLLMLTPLGIKVFVNYFGGILWIQSWPPLFAVLNNMMTNETQKRLQAETMGQDGISLVSQVGIGAIEADISAMAGYLSMSIPFIAIGIVYGVSRFAGLATSMLAVSQSGATQAAEEATVGNLSLANTNLDNHSFHNMQGFQHNTSARMDTGRMSVVGSSGYQTTVNQDGSVVMDSAGAISQLPTSFNLAQGVSTSLQRSASNEQSLAESKSQRASDMIGQTLQESRDVAKYLDQQNSLENSKTFSENSSERKALSESMSYLQNVSEQTGLDMGVLLAAGMSVDKRVGLKILGNGATIGGYGKAELSGANRDQYTEAESMLQDQGFQKNMEIVNAAISAETSRNQDTEGKNFRESIQTGLSEAQNLQNESGIHYQQAEQYREMASQVENQSVGMNHNMNQHFVEYLSHQKDRHGNELGMPGAAHLIRSNKAHEREQLDHHKSAFIEQYKEEYMENAVNNNQLLSQYEQRQDVFNNSHKLDNNQAYEDNKSDWEKPNSFDTEYKVDTQHIVNNAIITAESKSVIDEDKQETIREAANTFAPKQAIKNIANKLDLDAMNDKENNISKNEIEKLSKGMMKE